MEKSPNNEKKPADIPQQHIENEPKSGDRPDQGMAMTNDHYDPQGKPDADKRVLPAPDTVGNKRKFPILAQPPEAFTGLKLGKPADVAAGLPAVLKSGAFAWSEAGVGRGTHALLKLNQKDGFDCSSCAWPDPDRDRSIAEFCENGAKATASDADHKRVDPDFFAKHSVVELSQMTDRDLNNAGRITHPVVLRPGATHYTPIAWDDAFQLIADELNKLESPHEAAFYTSGKVPNEPAYVYQLFVRQFGTNNLPDCSNMCHESSGSALSPTVGLGKGSVTLNDIYDAEVIIIMGQNPGTNHPRMLSALQIAKRKGAKIISVNPLHEAGLSHFKNPQDFMNPIKAVGTLLGHGTPITDLFLQVKINGDMAVLRGIMKHLLDAEDKSPGTVVDHEFIRQYTTCYQEFVEVIRSTTWEDIEEMSGLSRGQLLEAANLLAHKKKIITCWAMGLTQQKNGVMSIQEIVNLHLLKGAIGIPGGGLCPVRGHSNVQGDRTMGIWERPHQEFLDALEKEYNFQPPREHGLDTVESIKAMYDGKIKVFLSLGGNLLSAGPDTEFIADCMRKQRLTAFVAPKLNRGHLTTGDISLILPCFTHLDIDVQKSGQQFTSCENSMGVVSRNKGVLEPLEGEMRSEVAIICGIAKATLGARSTVDWDAYTENYDTIRDAISRVIPGFEEFNEKIRKPGGFYLPNGPRERNFTTENGKANFSVTDMVMHPIEPDQLVLMTIRSHDQFNTTVYDYNDRYRGIHGERRIVFMNPQDMAERNIRERQLVNVTSHFEGQTRKMERLIAIPYNIPKGNTAAYYPEANVLVPVASVAYISNTPTSKFVIVTVEPVADAIVKGDGSTEVVAVA
ncbi:molybdopterin-dependent oxidoreductase alpha subunit [Larkinella arboricola]|uniref:Molybdopterin-dependent oxidoreductase alpha subunit n=1 Tax=Larkinella arboricola TaxID=643671 RepID=A0A327X663_LARAB|nr:FdhF/YdeP family oxidoreductase [Larkinella arboricola]RAK02425.1 molybdopterin-dependent oxidoreductase alpha subunit [Larkinella arboricola]